MHGVHRALLKFGSALILSALVSCGGGGGGSNPDEVRQPAGGNQPGANTFSVTLDKSSIDFSFQEGASPGPVLVTATALGDIPSPLYVGAVVEGLGLSRYIQTSFTMTGAEFRISPDSLPPGKYSGRVMFYACSDAQCNSPIGGTPIAVPFAVEIIPALKVPSQLTLRAVSGRAGQGYLPVQLPGSATSFTARVISGTSWLSVGQPNGTTLPVMARSLRSGYYYGTIEITSNQQSVSTQVVYEVSPPVGGDRDVMASPSSLTFAAIENTASQAQRISVSLPTWGGNRQDVQYSVKYNGSKQDWLVVRPTDSGLTVTASAAHLIQGYYTAEVLITHPESQLSAPVVVPVALSVGPGLVRPADQSIKVTTTAGASTLLGSAAVNLVEGEPFEWTASSNVPWLKVVRARGQTGSSVDFTVDKALLGAMGNYTDSRGTVTVTPVLAHVTPVAFNVSLRKELAELHYAGPYLLVSNKPQTVRLRGRGFNDVASISTYLDAGATNPTSVTKVNDGQLSLQLPALTAGSYSLTLMNALGLPTGNVALRVVNPTTFTYAAIPTNGNPYWLVYDAWRQAAFVANKETEAVVQYKFSADRWVRSQVSVPGISNLGMGPDGDNLVVTGSQGRLRLLSPDTLETQFQMENPEPFSESFTYLRFGIPATNDGRSWLTIGSGWNRLGYFDHRTRTIETPAWNMSTSYYGGPWMAMSRNGERMVVVQSASISPQPPLLFMDATDALLKLTGTDLTFSYDLQLSDDGNRLVLDGYEVRDANFGVVGRLAINDPQYSGSGNTVVSPDGKRVYMLSYPVNAYYEQNPTNKPKVFVFDSSAMPSIGVNLPLIGQFELNDYPTCHVSAYECNTRARMTISPDGQTLFMAGDANFVVAPIPSGATSSRAAKAMAVPTGGSAVPAAPIFRRWSPVPAKPR